MEDKTAVDAYDTESGQTPLILAAQQGHVKIVQTLCQKGRANVHLAGYQGLTVSGRGSGQLHVCARESA